MTRSAHAVRSTTLQNNISPLHPHYEQRARVNNGATAAAQNMFGPVNTRRAVPLHKPSRNEPNRNYYNGMQTPTDADNNYHPFRKSLVPLNGLRGYLSPKAP
jgi:hypothetical protein